MIYIRAAAGIAIGLAFLTMLSLMLVTAVAE